MQEKEQKSEEKGGINQEYVWYRLILFYVSTVSPKARCDAFATHDA